MQAFKIIGLLALAAVLGVVALVIMRIAPTITVPPFQQAGQQAATNFEECAAAGNPVMESYPRQCNTPDGRHFVEEVPQQPDPYQTPGMTYNGCAVAGCSQQLCVSAEEASTMVTTCEYRAEYACYAEASCEPQADGQCGWTETPELEQCLASPPPLDAGFEGEPQVM